MNRKVLIWTVSAGAIGGLAANITVFSEPAVWTAFGPASLFKYVITPLLLGALSAGIGVFVLTKTDTTDLIRTFFFAVICGLAFPEVIANAKRMATGQAADDARAHVLEESAQKLQSLASQPQPDPAAINRVADRVRNLSAHVESDDARLSALNALQSAAVTLNDPKEKAATIDRIKDVGVAAAARKDLSTTVRALNTIQALEARSEFAPVQDQLHRAQAELLQSVPAEARAGGDFVAVLPAEAASGQSPQ